MFVWLFQGNLGEGKTLGASVLSHYFASRAKRLGVPVDLYSNYGLQDSKELKSYKDFFRVAKSPNSIVVLDEAHVNLDSRLFGKGSNIYMTQFFFYLRKLCCSLFMTTPNIRNLDSRMRMLTNILVICNKWGGGFRYQFWDLQGERLLRTAYMPRHVAKEIFKCKIYNSHAIVRNVEFPNNERAFDSFLEKVVQIRSETYDEKREMEDEMICELLEEMPEVLELEKTVVAI
ncbi:zonular occludens toxin domain-containing protein [Desulforamulus aeronauticus]|uniref:Zonular occludens toxin (Zot) n=1 Tax=Desulforamulus aeronauticus DSM 10349 TaxID=1121421 RepID=A0A1M6WG78_9FIRM|nr:zonular occludens toxin domain-containing protein [Desulforamulus aeronauticus]SHK92606.1 Zonular occludens toxin (Zot) [Desulforamulus aeronauticus DSM 10349]